MQTRRSGILRPAWRCLSLCLLVMPGLCLSAGNTAPWVGSRLATPQIRGDISAAVRTELQGNVRPEFIRARDLGTVTADMPLPHLQLLLRRSAEQQAALDEYVASLEDKSSPNYHHWLSATEFGQRFGVAQADIDRLVAWLESSGFTVNTVYPNALMIDFSGTASAVHRAFGTELHYLDVGGKRHVANAWNPQLPAALAPVVSGISALHDFHPHSQRRMKQDLIHNAYTYTDSSSTVYQAVTPADLAVIYNLTPVFNAGYSGQGQTIALVEDSDIYSASDWTTFRNAFGLSGYTSGALTQVNPAPPVGGNNCADPGINSNAPEANLDAEYASAAAPDATIMLASCDNSTTTWGGQIALENLVNSPSPPAIISVSYGACETGLGAAGNATFLALFQQAAAEGISVFVSSGDEGPASCDSGGTSGTYGVTISGLATTPYNVAVGGTDFADSYYGTNSTFWSSSNTAAYGSALSYVTEIPWNDSCAGSLLFKYMGFTFATGQNGLCNNSSAATNGLINISAGGGGPSRCATGVPQVPGVVSGTCKGYAKPAWQKMYGNPGDNKRGIPDISLFAADGMWGHYYAFCWSDVANGGATCSGAPENWSGAGGTSFSAPVMAGIQALVNQRTGASHGNPNPVYYAIAKAEYGSTGNPACYSSNTSSTCTFHDITTGDTDVPCTTKYNCAGYRPVSATIPKGMVGVLKKGGVSYPAKKGWDFATGIGSVNAYNLVFNPLW